MPTITDKFVKNLEPPTAKPHVIYYDEVVKGFGVRVTKAGVKSFVLNYHVLGRERRITIGQYPAWGIAAAREQASTFRRQADNGDDPLEQRNTRKQEATVQDLWQRYEEAELPRKSKDGSRDEKSMWRRWILPELGKRRLSEIQLSDIEQLHRKISAEVPVSENRMLASLRFAFNRAIAWKLVKENPTRFAQFNAERPRDVTLPRTSFETVQRLLATHKSQHAADAISFILLTGCRRGEAAKATWDQFDEGLTVWTKPSSSTKQRRIHRVPLSQAATELLSKRKQHSKNEWVFDVSPQGLATAIKRTWSEIRSESGCREVRIHDLRHTFASVLVSSGQSLNIVGKMLGHSQAQTTMRYAHYFEDALRGAAEKASQALQPKQKPDVSS